jgi:hypothetical protein
MREKWPQAGMEGISPAVDVGSCQLDGPWLPDGSLLVLTVPSREQSTTRHLMGRRSGSECGSKPGRHERACSAELEVDARSGLEERTWGPASNPGKSCAHTADVRGPHWRQVAFPLQTRLKHPAPAAPSPGADDTLALRGELSEDGAAQVQVGYVAAAPPAVAVRIRVHTGAAARGKGAKWVEGLPAR